MTNRMLVTVASITAALLVTPPTARGVNLSSFLTEVDEVARFTAPARASLRIHWKTPNAEHTYEGVVIHRGADVYIELREPTLKVLILGTDEQVHIVTGSGPPHRSGVHDPIGDTALIADDFRPFHAGAIKTPQITSETKRNLLVTGAPSGQSRYVLLVYLLDREKRLPVRIQYYERTVSNLVRMRRDDAVRVGGVWRSHRTEIDDFEVDGRLTIERTWTTDVDIPADLFDPKALASRTLLGGSSSPPKN